MKVSIQPNEQRQLVIEATFSELADLHDALKRGRKTKKDQQILHDLADNMRRQEPNLGRLVDGEEDQVV